MLHCWQTKQIKPITYFLSLWGQPIEMMPQNPLKMSTELSHLGLQSLVLLSNLTYKELEKKISEVLSKKLEKKSG